MTLSHILESSGKQIVVIFPGRFQPFHRGHKAIFDYLNKNYDNVYIATSDKVALPKSPFNFNEKKKMMELTGMDTSKVVQTKSPYQAAEIVQHFDKQNTILLFAVSEKDMASDPRFGFKPKKDGSPSYFQPKPKDMSQAATMDQHGYIVTVPTFDFDVLGQPMKSATEVRSAFSSMDNGTKKKLIKDLFGNYSDEVFNLMTAKITEQSIHESSFSTSNQYGYSQDKNRVFGGMDGQLIKATKSLRELFHKVQNVKPGTKVRARFLTDFHSLIAKIKQQMAMNVEIKESVTLAFNTRELDKSQLKEYYVNRFASTKQNIFQSRYSNDAMRYARYQKVMEANGELRDIESWLAGTKSTETATHIKVGDSIAIIELDISVGWSEIILGGFTVPKEITDIDKSDGKINVIRFIDGSSYPKDADIKPTYKNRPLQVSYFYNNSDDCNKALTYIRVSTPNDWEILDEMSDEDQRITESMNTMTLQNSAGNILSIFIANGELMIKDVKTGKTIKKPQEHPNFLKSLHKLGYRTAKGGINEGGWADTVTQKTKLTPSVVQTALKVVGQFTSDFNAYLADQNHPPVEMGSPTGSSAYHAVDDSNKEYGDIDLQMIGPDDGEKTPNQLTAFYNKLADQFIIDKKPSYVYDQGKPAHGHVIFKIGNDHVQVDLMWSGKALSDWSRWRVTPQRGIKGLIYGNMYSAFGDVISLSIQKAGVQLKTIDGQPAPFNKRKGTELQTISNDISNFGLDILKAVHKGAGEHGDIIIDPLLQQNPGLKKADIKITDLAKTIKGLAKSFEANDLYGKYILQDYSSDQDLINAFLARFEAKAHEAAYAPKFNKASGDAELNKVKSIQDQISKGLSLVKQAFMENHMKSRNIAIYNKGSEVVGLWESNGKLLLVDHKTKIVKETSMKKNAVKRMLDVKGWELDESVTDDIMSLINAAGDVLKVRHNKAKGTTSIQHKGGTLNKQEPLVKVLGQLQKKGYARNDSTQQDHGGLSLEPQDSRPHSEQGGHRGGGHFMDLKASVDAEVGGEEQELMANKHRPTYDFEKRKNKMKSMTGNIDL